ncbi:protein ROOT INITIATION DEFECTIVE 3-like [Mangifera indica]|uniref:protein ROOT INITIATION DEFECTIVE 3-like n=1 Tax=Mangifera indica TaxID=29780 RepID=UPI001CFA6844|nr:protein ROOT INITIATION DEFECTIVE 3-like [Mangifera indica]
MSEGSEALVVCSDRSLKVGMTIWDIETGDQILRIPSCAASPHGLLCLRNQYLAASQVNRHGSLGGGSVFMWALNKPQPPLRSYTMEAMGPICCSNDGVYLAGGASSGNAYIWEVANGRLLAMWRAHYKSLKCMVFSDDGSLLISGSDDGMICIWSMIRLMKKTSEMMHHSNHSESCLLEMEDSGSETSLLHYSLEHKSSITGLLTVSSSHFVSCSLDATCKVWDLISGRLIQTQVYPLALTAILLDLVRLLMFVGSVDGRIFVNRLEFGIGLDDPIIVAEDESRMLKGHSEAITALTLSASYLISASEDRTVCLWDVSRRVIVRRFDHDKGPVTNLLVIPKFSLLSSSSHQKVSNKFRISLLDKYPQQDNFSKGMKTLLHSHFSRQDDEFCKIFQGTKSLDQYMCELQLEGTPAAMEMKVETSTDYRTWATRMTKHVMEMNKHLQSRLLDLMQCRLLRSREADLPATRNKKKLKIESLSPSDE